MLEQIAIALFPDEILSPRGRRLRLAALCLFPLALAAGFALQVRNFPPPSVQTTIDAAQAISIARSFAAKQGIPAENWSAKITYSSDTAGITFVNARSERLPIWKIAPPVSAGVNLRSDSGKDALSVSISVDGRVLGFNWTNPSIPKEGIAEGEALQIAQRQLAQLPPPFNFGAPTLDTKVDTGDRIYTFRSATLPGMDIRAIVAVRGSHVISFKVKADPTDEAEKSEDRTQTVLTLAGTCFLALVALYSIYRYVSRTLQQEVSHSRSLMVALLCGCFCVLIGMNAVVNTSAGEVPITIILIVFAVLGLIAGALLAAAYGSGEGDIREAYPGKLTSLDALLTGNAWSRNVGASVLFGLACSGWLALVLGIMEIPLRVQDPQGSQELIAPFIRFGYLMPWMTYPLMSVAFAAAGLLQPLAFLQRYAGRFKRLHGPALVICAGLVSTMRIHTQSTAEFLVVSSVFVASLLVPFFELDLLASIVCVTTFFSVVSVAGGVASIPAFASRALVTHLAPLAILSVFALLSIRSGRVCVEEQVRPLYARHIAERKSLEAEVSAAREAQLRLLPETLPQFGSLDIAAVCVPAETVGGDFYDFFQLGDGRLGVFIAEGNNRGLAAALTIALAKGYLMHSVSRSSDPVEILTRLETALGAIFNANVWGNEDEGSAPLLTEFAFAAIDTGAGTIRYARTSVYPKVVIVSENGQAATERTVPVKGRATPIAEGWAAFRQGDHVLLFTDGVGRRLGAGNRRPDDVASLLAREAQQPDRIKHAVLDYSRATAEPDDLTLIVIRATAEAALDRNGALGVVA